ncbi:hypothetical protein MXB_3897 [Myxobolus squamalis]|nr:hypothetical protein MXB_3897 [Myxobolus squamalis]
MHDRYEIRLNLKRLRSVHLGPLVCKRSVPILEIFTCYHLLTEVLLVAIAFCLGL